MNTDSQNQSQANVRASSLMAQADSAPTNIREFLAFKLGTEEYGIDILRVQEIRSYEEPTRMANAPAHILGVLNLRGVILLNIGVRVVAMVVDSVSDAITREPEQLRPVPEFASAVSSDHLLAIGSV